MTQSIQNNEKIAKSFPHLNYSGDNENYGTIQKPRKSWIYHALLQIFMGPPQ